MSNPMLNDKTFQQQGGVATLPPPDPRSANLAAEAAAAMHAPQTQPAPTYGGPIERDGAMTMSGTVLATGAMLALLLIGGTVGWIATETDELGNVSMPFWIWIAMIGGVVAAIVASVKPPLARFLAPVYALAYGTVVGGISKFYETQWNGIVIQAIGATVGVFAVVLAMYALRIVKVTNRFRSIVMAATLGLMLFYLVSFVLSFFGATPSFISEPSALGIGFSVVAAGIAALNLFLDFDIIERGVQMGAPKYMEWYGAMALTVTLVWLYLEMLRLLSKLRSN
jgi:uncharacterized YccA/Bax inhibitor family protein